MLLLLRLPTALPAVQAVRRRGQIHYRPRPMSHPPAMATSQSPATTTLRRAALLAFVLTLAWRTSFFLTARWLPGTGTGNFFLVQGQPFGDALAWHEAAQLFTTGGELYFWNARRLAYPLLLAMAYVWTGATSNTAVAINLILGAATAALLIALLVRMFSWTVALAAMAWFLVDHGANTCACVPLSETMGAFFSVWSAWLLVRALDGPSPSRLLLASGLAFGMANVTRTLTAAALPLLLLALVVHARRSRGDWQSSRNYAGAFAIGTLLLVLPAMLWNYAQHGIFTLSDNTAMDLFAGTSPEFQTYSGRVEQLADEAGAVQIGDRYRFFMDRTRENFARHPRWIAQQALLRSWIILGHSAQVTAVIFWCLARLIGVRRAGGALTHPRNCGPPLALLAACFLPGPGAAVLLTLALIAALISPQTSRVEFLALLVIAVVLPLALFGQGGNEHDRLYLVFRWAAVALLLGLADRVCRRLAAPAPGREPPRGLLPGEPLCAVPPRVARVVIVAGSLWAITSLGVLAYRNYLSPTTHQFQPLPRGIAEALLREAMSIDDTVFALRERTALTADSVLAVPRTHWEWRRPNGRLALWEGELMPEMYYFPLGVRPTLRWRSLNHRDYERTVAPVRTLPAFGWPVPFVLNGVTFPGDLRPLGGERVLVLGRINDDPSRPMEGPNLEGIAIVPFDRAGAQLDLSRAVFGAKSPQHREVLIALCGQRAPAP